MQIRKRLIFTGLLLFIFPFCANSQTSDPRIKKDLRLMDLGNPKAALADLHDMAATNPKNPEAHAALGLALIETGDIATADKEIATAYDLERKNVLVRIARGTLNGKKGKREDAVEEFNRAIKINDKDIATYLALAHYYITIDSLKSAEVILYRAQSVSANDVRPFFGLAELYEKQHIPDLAIEQYQEAKKIDQKDPAIYTKLAQLYMRAHKPNEALKEWDNLTKIDSTYARAYLEMARIYDQTDDHADAAKYAEKYVLKTPEDMEGIWLLALSLAESNQYSKALPYLEKVSKNDSLKTYTDLYLARSYFFSKEYEKANQLYSVSKSLNTYDLYYYGYSLVSVGDTNAAIEKFKLSLAADTNHKADERLKIRQQIIGYLGIQKKYPEIAALNMEAGKIKNSAPDYEAAGQFYNFANMPNEAHAAFDAALKINPKSVKAHTGIADAMEKSQDSLAAAEKIIDDAAGNAATPEDKEAIGNAYARLGIQYYTAKDYESCSKVMEEKALIYLTKKSPFLINVYKVLGAAYLQQQNYKKATEYYKKALEIDPKDEDAKKGLDYMKQVGK